MSYSWDVITQGVAVRRVGSAWNNGSREDPHDLNGFKDQWNLFVVTIIFFYFYIFNKILNYPYKKCGFRSPNTPLPLLYKIYGIASLSAIFHKTESCEKKWGKFWELVQCPQVSWGLHFGTSPLQWDLALLENLDLGSTIVREGLR